MGCAALSLHGCNTAAAAIAIEAATGTSSVHHGKVIEQNMTPTDLAKQSNYEGRSCSFETPTACTVPLSTTHNAGSIPPVGCLACCNILMYVVVMAYRHSSANRALHSRLHNIGDAPGYLQPGYN